MRAGCFAEDRVIKLIDRRFVPFFFNRSGMGEGFDKAASAFVGKKTENPYAYFAAFTPDGEIVGETEIYADKDATMGWLIDLLEKHPEYAASTAVEAAVLGKGGLAAAQLAEDLADYAAAAKHYRELLEHDAADTRAQACNGILRIARYGQHWESHAAAEKMLRKAVKDGADQGLLVDADVELGYRLLAEEEFQAARELLQPLALRAGKSKRLAEAHFSAGRACWYLGDRDWAKFHWGFVVDQMPDDRLYMRARIAAAAEGMPYPNAELGDYKSGSGSIGTHNIVQAVAAAMDVHRRLLPRFEAGDFTGAPANSADPGKPRAAPPATRLEDQSPILLVSRLRDGNTHVPDNNQIVDRLEAMGLVAVAPLMAAIEDRKFPGRGYAAWALSQVLKASSLEHKAAMDVLETARKDRNPYVAELARSGLSTLVQ